MTVYISSVDMENLAGFSSLPPQLQMTLRTMRDMRADLAAYYQLVSGQTKETQIVIFYYALGKKEVTAQLLRTSPKRVRRAIAYFQQHGEIPDPLPMGQPTKKTPATVASIQALVLANRRVSIPSLQQHLMRNGTQLSYGTINAILHELKFEFKPPKVRQQLTPAHVQARLRFGFSLIEADLLQFPILFSDESRFALGSDGRWIWRRRGDVDDAVFLDRTKFPASVMVWACIGVGFRSALLFCDNSVTAVEYRRILKEAQLFETADATYGDGMYLFMQDGATPHTEAKSIRYITSQANLLNHWPPNSPDLNPIENLWGILKTQIRALGPRNAAEMKNCLEIIWDSLDQSMIDRLVQSFRYRIYLMLIHGGLAIGPYMRPGHNNENLVCPPRGETQLYDDMVLGPETDLE